MKLKLPSLWVPIWFGPRAYWALAVLAVLAASAAPLHVVSYAAAAAGAACAALLLADLALMARPHPLAVRRETPDAFAMRRRGALSYTVRNESGMTLRAGIVESGCPLLRYETDELIVHVPAHSELTATRPLLPVMRGTADLGTMYVWFESPIGLLRRRMRTPQPAQVRVYPDLSAVERYGALHARNRLIEAGLRRMRLRGAGTEPESVREWMAGDPFRSIDWKASARTGKTMVAQYEVERSQNVMVVLDAGRLMMARVDEQRKFDYAITAALSVASIAALANDKVGFVAFAGEIIRAAAPRQSGRSLQRLTQQLHDVEPRFEESDYERAFAYVRAQVRKRSLIIFFTDVIDPVAQSTVLSGLGSLSRQHLVVCAFMNDAAIENALAGEAADAKSAYAQGVALELLDERKAAAATLARLGVRVIDVPARDLTTALIDRYLQIKQRGEL